MAELGIICDGKYCRYGDYRYDRFVDALNCAQLEHKAFAVCGDISSHVSC